MKARKTPESGISDFRKFILNNNYFVDKTLFIRDFFTSNSHVSLMPRPKRFGKTLNLSMIEHFFDIQKPENKELFAECKIAEDKEFCQQHQNQYPVINISLKDVKADNWEMCLEKFKYEISDLYSKHIVLLESDKLTKFEKNRFELIVNGEVPQARLEYSLHALSQYLYKHFNKEVMILVDEYDVPIISAFNNTNPPIKSENKKNKTYYEKVVNFMQTFMGRAYKGNMCLKKGLLTGVLRISRESMFSDWNNVDVYDIKMPYYTDSFGFTTDEVQELLNYFNLQDKFEDVKRWYNGYTFGNKNHIYNPWSIMRYVGKPNAGLQAYWVNSSENPLIRERIVEKGAKQAIEALISGKSVKKVIKNNFVFSHFEKSGDLLWTLLFYSGFLTTVKVVDRDVIELRIPNREVRTAFTDIIINWLEGTYNIGQYSLWECFNHLVSNELYDFERCLKTAMQDSISYFDIGSNNQISREQILHVYTLGLLAILSDKYIIKSNKESGEGRYDIIIIPRDKTKYGVVIEIKSIEGQKENEDKNKFVQRVNTKINEALHQIERNEYYKELIVAEIKPENIIKLPIVFAGKVPYINELKVN